MKTKMRCMQELYKTQTADRADEKKDGEDYKRVYKEVTCCIDNPIQATAFACFTN
jgi:hypothetical protein